MADFEYTLSVNADLTKLKQQLDGFIQHYSNTGDKAGKEIAKQAGEALNKITKVDSKQGQTVNKQGAKNVLNDLKGASAEYGKLIKMMSDVKNLSFNKKLNFLDASERKVIDDVTTALQDYNKALGDLEGKQKAVSGQKSAIAQLTKDRSDIQNQITDLRNYDKVLEKVLQHLSQTDAGGGFYRGKSLATILATPGVSFGQIQSDAQALFQKQGWTWGGKGTKFKNNGYASLMNITSNLTNTQLSKDINELVTSEGYKKKITGLEGQESQITKQISDAQVELGKFNQQLHDTVDTINQNYDKVSNFFAVMAGRKPKNGKVTSTTSPVDAKAKKTGLNDEVKQAKEEAVDISQGLQQVEDHINEATPAVAELDAAHQELNKSLVAFSSIVSQNNMLQRRIEYFFSWYNAINLLKRGIKQAVATIKELDSAMEEIAVVTNFDIGDMWEMLPTYTQYANELGVAVSQMYKASALYYQQGLNTNQAMTISNETLKMARIAGLDAATATDRMTNAMRAFNMELNEKSAQHVNDVYSAIAARTASNVNELSTAMTKVASLAASVGVGFEQTTAYLATGIETTRESADAVGTALKTVLARMAEVKQADNGIATVDGEVADINKMETAFKAIGITLRDSNGQIRDMGPVLEELNQKWGSLDRNTQRYIATTAAGSRQQSRFIAMMSDYSRTTEILGYGLNSAGESQAQFDKTTESLQTKMQRLTNAWNEFLMNIANNDIIKGAIDMLTGLVNALNKIVEILPGAGRSVVTFTTAFAGFTGIKVVLDSLLHSFSEAAKNGSFKWLWKTDSIKAIGSGLNTIKNAAVVTAHNLPIVGKAISGVGSAALSASVGLGVFAAIIAAVVVGVMTLTAAIKDAEAHNTAAGRLETINDALQDVNQTISETTSNIESLKSAWDNISETENTLTNLRRGSTEWYEAILACNEETLKLLETNKDLKIIMKDGLMTIDENSYQDYLKQQENELKQLNNSKLYLTGTKRYAEVDVKLSNFDSEIIYKKMQLQEGGDFTNYSNAEIAQMLLDNNEIPEDEINELTETLQELNDTEKILTETYGNMVQANVGENYSAEDKNVIGFLGRGGASAAEEYYQNISQAELDKRMKEYVEEHYGVQNASFGLAANEIWGYDAAGKKVAKQTADIEQEVRAEIMAEQAEKDATKYSQEFEKVMRSEYGQTISALINDDIESVNWTDLTENLTGFVQKLKDVGVSTEDITNLILDAYEELNKETARTLKSLGNSKAYQNAGKEAISGFIKGLKELSNGQQIQLGGLVESMENLGPEAAEAFWGSFINYSKENDGEINTELLTNRAEFVEEISQVNFNNPIQAVSQLNRLIEKGSKSAKEFAKSYKELNKASLSFSVQMRTLLDSANYEDLNKQIDKIFNKRDKITGTEIKELTNQFEDLQTILDNNSLSASKLAAILTSSFSKNGNTNIAGISDALITAFAAVPTFEDTVAKVIEDIETFKEGPDSDRGLQWLTEVGTNLAETLLDEQYANTKVKEYIDFVFGKDTWNKLLASEHPEEAIKEKINEIDRYSVGDGYNVLKDFASGVLSSDAFKVTGADSNYDFTLEINAGTTTQQLVQDFAKAAGVTEEAASMFVNNWITRSPELLNILKNNDLSQAILKYATSGQLGHSDDIAAIAKAYGSTEQEVQKIYDELIKKIGTTQVIIDDESLRDGKILEAIGKAFNVGIEDIFTKFNGVKYGDIADGGKQTYFENAVNADVVEQLLRELGMEQYAEQAFDQLAEMGQTLMRSYIDSNGSIKYLSAKDKNSLDLKIENATKLEDTKTQADIFAPIIESAVINALVETGNTGEDVNLDELETKINEKQANTINTKMDNLAASMDAAASAFSQGINVNISGTLGSFKEASSKSNSIRWDSKAKKWVAVGSTAKVDTQQVKINQNADNANKAAKGTNLTQDIDRIKNPYDWLYNLQQLITRTQHERTLAQKQEMLYLEKGAGFAENYLRSRKKQLNAIRAEIVEQKKLYELRGQEYQMYKQIYSAKTVYDAKDHNGKTSDITVNATKYAWLTDDDRVELDWDAIEELKNDMDFGAETLSVIQEYVGYLEKEASDRQAAQEAQIQLETEYRQTLKENRSTYNELVTRVADAYKAIDEKKLKEMELIKSAIDEVNSNIIDGLQKSIDGIRQDAQNRDTQQNLANTRRRIAYLSQDTTGANAAMIKQLKYQLDKDTQSYRDSRIDQAVQLLQDQNTAAEIQREKQIELLQAQIEWSDEYGVYMSRGEAAVESCIENGVGNVQDSELYEVLYVGEGWIKDTGDQIAEKTDELEQDLVKANEWLEFGRDKLEELKTLDAQGFTDVVGAINKVGGQLAAALKSTIEAYENTINQLRKDLAEERERERDYGGSGGGNGGNVRDQGGGNSMDKTQGGVGVTNSGNAGNSRIGYVYSQRDSNGKEQGVKEISVQVQVDYIKNRFAKGGVADFTGPAWLDGTKSKPEAVLNAADTQNFISLLDTLQALKNQGGNMGAGSYAFDIDINVDELGNDYDVEKLSKQVEQRITNAMTYRNVTSVGRLK